MHHGVVLRSRQFLSVCRYACINAFLEVGQCFSHGTVQRYHSRCTVSLAAYGTELESVTCKSEWRRAVTVGIVDEQLRNLRDIQLVVPLTLHAQRLTSLNVVEQF